MMKRIFFIFGKLCALICPMVVLDKLRAAKTYLNSGYVSRRFASYGQGSLIEPHCILRGEQYIHIGEHVILSRNSRLTAYDQQGEQHYTPYISIGNNVHIGAYSHITAIHRIVIGDGVLTGNKILITDNAHGISNPIPSDTPPFERQLVSKGAVVIGNNVWIGENVVILPNVNIGEGAIIGANSVVTHDIPPYSIAVGSPARVVK